MSILEVHRIEDEGIEVQVLTGETNQEGDGTSEVALKALGATEQLMYDTKFEIRIVIDGNGNPYELIITC